MRSFFYFLQAFPSFIIALLIAALLGPSSATLLFALFFGMLPSLCKLLWDRLDEIESETWMQGAHAVGLHGKVLFHHYYFKPLWELVSVKVPNYIGHLLLAEATLSFLGVGAPVGSDTWGLILLQGSEYLLEAPHIALLSGIPLVLLNLSLLKILKTS